MKGMSVLEDRTTMDMSPVQAPLAIVPCTAQIGKNFNENGNEAWGR